MNLASNLSRSEIAFSTPDYSAPDIVQQFRERLTVHLQKRLRRGESIDTTEARAILALAAQILGGSK